MNRSAGLKTCAAMLLAAGALGGCMGSGGYGRDLGYAPPPREWRGYDADHYEPGQDRYYADRYYRDNPRARERRLGRNDRLYRGRDGRYYCRRNDGTTGLIVGALAGGVLGNVIDGGDSRLLGTLIGGGGGALLGREIERGQVRCR